MFSLLLPSSLSFFSVDFPPALQKIYFWPETNHGEFLLCEGEFLKSYEH